MPEITRPNFSRLAFWKKDSDQALPRPPSRHFDPEPLKGQSDESQAATEIQNRLNHTLASGKEPQEGQQPIRKPYELDNLEQKVGGGLSEFDASIQKTKSAINDSVSKGVEGYRQASGSLADATKDLQSEFSKSVGLKSDGSPDSQFAGSRSEFTPSSSAQPIRPAADSGLRANDQISDSRFDPRPPSRAKPSVEPLTNQNFNDSRTDFPGRMASSQLQPIAKQSAPNGDTGSSFTSPNYASAPATKQALKILDGAESAVNSALANGKPKSSTSDLDSQFNSKGPSYPVTPFEKIQPRQTGPARSFSNNSESDTSVPISAGQSATSQFPPFAAPAGKKPSPRVPDDYPVRSAGSVSSTESTPAVRTTGGIEADLPKKILQGNSTYAPGSVRRLQPIDDQWQPPSG